MENGKIKKVFIVKKYPGSSFHRTSRAGVDCERKHDENRFSY
jgi:hypothetical protein